ncbi:MAG: aldehyde dehydrogenase family protein [Anaerolineales bacterium]
MDTLKLDQSIQALQEHKNEWASLPIPEKLALLDAIRQRLAEKSLAWVEASVRGKQMKLHSPEEGEEWTGGPWTLAEGINGYMDSLRSLAQGQVLMPKRIHTRSNGQVAARIFPNTLLDRLMLNGITAEVWMQPGVTEVTLEEKMAAFYRQKNVEGKVCLVLGAGNVAGIPPRDVLYRLYGLGHVVILKMSPINDYLGPIFEYIFAPFVQAGYLRFAYGGGDVGNYLVHHAGVQEIHMTGSVHTYQAILFGNGPEGEQRKRQNRPLLDKPFTGELGGVTPTIIVPGKWSRADIRYQAENVLTMKLQNAGHNCVATQVLVLSETWGQRDEFLDAVRKLMRELPPRKCYYPGAAEHQKEAVALHPDAEILGGEIPRTLITGLDPNAEDEACFQEEFFCPVFAQTSLPGKDAADFLRNAVRFCNEKLYGTLGVSVIIHPGTRKQLGPDFEAALTDLHYGSIGVNIWNAAAFLLVQATWGAFPGHTTDNIQSGFGIVGNSFLFEKPERTVVRGSFYPFPRTWLHGDPAFLPKPPWFITNKTAHITTREVARITLDPKFRYLPAILWYAYRG